ncbi:transcription antitermination factor NusB [Salinithrix halophila]|uniref:Transcription antitermination protein NusB n=1 Tax=Salinithrix halophila TaxID=1485204 RepID=A0ABV8JKA4_9BACL
MGRRQARERTLQALYQLEMNPGAGEQVFTEHKSRLEEDVERKEDLAFFHRLMEGVRKHRNRLDPIIQRFLKKDWTLSRLSLVDRMILRMAVYELLFEEEVPFGATLNEAVELAKTFSTEESARFINGVLGNILKNMEEVQGTLSLEEK